MEQIRYDLNHVPYSNQKQSFIDPNLSDSEPPLSGYYGKIALEMSLGALQSARLGQPYKFL